jgi:hypothetical protein
LCSGTPGATRAGAGTPRNDQVAIYLFILKKGNYKTKKKKKKKKGKI